MKESHHKAKSFRDKLYDSVTPDQRHKIDYLLKESTRGSDLIEGIRRSRTSYLADSPRNLPRGPRKER